MYCCTSSRTRTVCGNSPVSDRASRAALDELLGRDVGPQRRKLLRQQLPRRPCVRREAGIRGNDRVGDNRADVEVVELAQPVLAGRLDRPANARQQPLLAQPESRSAPGDIARAGHGRGAESTARCDGRDRRCRRAAFPRPPRETARPDARGYPTREAAPEPRQAGRRGRDRARSRPIGERGVHLRWSRSFGPFEGFVKRKFQRAI